MSMVIPFPSTSKNVLLVSDEGVAIYHASRKSQRLIDHISWVTSDFEAKLLDILRNDCPKKPVIILYDMVEQHYRKERVPKVGFFDKSNIVKHRLANSFPNYKMRAALALKPSNHKDSGKDVNTLPYLFAAVPTSELTSSLIRAVVESGLPIGGFYLLPVEAVNFVTKFAKKLFAEKSDASEWTLFMGQHSGGNLRQIITKNGELALTRMTPFSVNQSDASEWSQSIFQEYKVTTSYLARLGYKSEDGINVVVVCDEASQELTENQFSEEVRSISVISLSEAAGILGLTVTTAEQEEDYADYLSVAWMSGQTTYTMPLPISRFEQATLPRMVGTLALIVALGAAGWFSYQAGLQGFKYMEVLGDLDVRKAQLSGETQKNKQLLDEMEAQGYDIRLYRGAFAAHEELDAYTLKPFTILKGVADGLGPFLKIDEIVLRHADGSEIKFQNLGEGRIVRTPQRAANQGRITGNPASADQDGYQLYSRMSMTFSAGIRQEEANSILEDLVQQIAQRLPGYDVQLEKSVRDRTYELDVEGRIGRQQEEEPDIQQENSAVIEIRGKV